MIIILVILLDIAGIYKMVAVLSKYDAGVSIKTIRNHKSADGSTSKSFSSYNAHLDGSNYNKEHDIRYSGVCPPTFPCKSCMNNS